MVIDIRKFMGRFVEEARDHLARLGEGLAALDAGHVDPEGVNALFRSAHTIKGSSRMLRLMSISETAHKLEDELGALREGSLAFIGEMSRPQGTMPGHFSLTAFRAAVSSSQLVGTSTPAWERMSLL